MKLTELQPIVIRYPVFFFINGGEEKIIKINFQESNNAKK